MAQHRTVRLPNEMIEAIEEIRNRKSKFGFQSNAEFVKHSIRELMLRLDGEGK
jgi:Arc/MetJ-type ribon-helix-helix transcriptional regulator